MDCTPWQDAISAMVDGEHADVDPRLVAAHVAHCVDCGEFQRLTERGRRHDRLQLAEPVPDLSGRIVKLNALADRAGRWSVIRACLAVVAVEIIVFALPQLVLGAGAADEAHVARHVGAFSVAYAVALLVVVVRPARARTVLPIAAVLAATLLITSITDLASGHALLVTEASHLPELISVGLVWCLAVPSPLRRRRTPVPSTGSPLRLVDEEPEREIG